MRLGFFYRDYLQPGAYPRDTKLLSEALAKRVEHVYVYCYCKQSGQQGEWTVGNVTTCAYYVPERYWTFNFVSVPRALRDRLTENRDRVDLVTLIGAFVPENYPVARLLHGRAIPYVVSPGEPINRYALNARGLKWLRKWSYFRFFERVIFENAAAVQVASAAHMIHHLQLGIRLHPAKFFVGREAIDWENLRNEFGEDAPVPVAVEDVDVDRASSGPPTFGYLGRLRVFHKGLDVLVEAWGIYKALGGDGRLMLVGPGSPSEQHRLAELCERHRATDVEILPPKYGPEKLAYLRSLSALVHPSRHDGLTRVIREGLASGCVLITTYDTHIYELLEKHDAGLVVALDPFELARTLLEFAGMSADENREMRRNVGAVARDLNWDAGADQFLRGIESSVFGANDERHGDVTA